LQNSLQLATDYKKQVVVQDVKKSFDTFGGEQDRTAFFVNQSVTSFERALNKSSNLIMSPHRYRSPHEPGVGVFEHICGDLALIKTGLELTENDRI
jgi:hypothetical protein